MGTPIWLEPWPTDPSATIPWLVVGKEKVWLVRKEYIKRSNIITYDAVAIANPTWPNYELYYGFTHGLAVPPVPRREHGDHVNMNVEPVAEKRRLQTRTSINRTNWGQTHILGLQPAKGREHGEGDDKYTLNLHKWDRPREHGECGDK